MKYLLALSIIITNIYAQDSVQTAKNQSAQILLEENKCAFEREHIVHKIEVQKEGLSTTPNVAKTLEGDIAMAYKGKDGKDYLELYLCPRKDMNGIVSVSNTMFHLMTNDKCSVNSLTLNAMLGGNHSSYMLNFFPVQIDGTSINSSLCHGSDHVAINDNQSQNKESSVSVNEPVNIFDSVMRN